jgi:eukaryotic translation initiation factor 2C
MILFFSTECDFLPSTNHHFIYSGEIEQQFGISLDVQMTEVMGRILPPPNLRLGAPNGQTSKFSINQDGCQSNLMNKKL